jgi:hypothetical protein
VERRRLRLGRVLGGCAGQRGNGSLVRSRAQIMALQVQLSGESLVTAGHVSQGVTLRGIRQRLGFLAHHARCFSVVITSFRRVLGRESLPVGEENLLAPDRWHCSAAFLEFGDRLVALRNGIVAVTISMRSELYPSRCFARGIAHAPSGDGKRRS